MTIMDLSGIHLAGVVKLIFDSNSFAQIVCAVDNLVIQTVKLLAHIHTVFKQTVQLRHLHLIYLMLSIYASATVVFQGVGG